MKKLFLSFALIVATVAASAQSKGDIVVGGSLELSSVTGKSKVGSVETVSGKESGFSIMPEVQYFVTDNISVGAGIGYEMASELDGHTASGDKELFNKNSTFLFTPTAYYYIQLTDKFYYTPGVALIIGSGSGIEEYEDIVAGADTVAEHKLTTSSFGIGIDLAQFEYKPTSHIGIGVGLGLGEISYVSATSKNKDLNVEGSASRFNLGISDNFTISNIKFSFKYYF